MASLIFSSWPRISSWRWNRPTSAYYPHNLLAQLSSMMTWTQNQMAQQLSNSTRMKSRSPWLISKSNLCHSGIKMTISMDLWYRMRLKMQLMKKNKRRRSKEKPRPKIQPRWTSQWLIRKQGRRKEDPLAVKNQARAATLRTSLLWWLASSHLSNIQERASQIWLGEKNCKT